MGRSELFVIDWGTGERAKMIFPDGVIVDHLSLLRIFRVDYMPEHVLAVHSYSRITYVHKNDFQLRELPINLYIYTTETN